jgi:hypothetical protein
VRAALAELRDPKLRIVHELWAQAPTGSVAADALDAADTQEAQGTPHVSSPNEPRPSEGLGAAVANRVREALGWRRL